MYDRYISHDQPILVSCIYPPIPCRDHDYCAHFDCFGEEGPNGFGANPEAAIHDLWMAASAGDWFDEAFWEIWERAEAETAESARENAAVDWAQERMERLFGDGWLMGEEYPK